MKISDVRIREVLIPRIYETYASDKLNLQDDDHKRSHYQIIELFTDEGFVGLGEVSDIANRMNPLTAGELRDILNKTAVGFELEYWPLIYKKTAQELPKNIHPELKGLTLFGLEIALLDLVGKKYGAPLFELLGGQYRKSVEVCWVLYLRGDISIDEELNALGLEVKEKRKEGFSAFKMKVGDDHDRDMQRISKFRTICGPEVYLRVDASGNWEEKEAIEKINDMSKAGVNACESPLLVVNRAVANDNPEKINKLTDENVKDWELPNPAGLEISAVRNIRDDIKKRVEKLIKKAINKSRLYEESVDDFALKYAKLKNSPRRLSNAQIAESMYMSTRTLQRRLKDAKLKGRKIGKSTASRKTTSDAKWGKVVDLIDSCDI